jgi:MFS family permease
MSDKASRKFTVSEVIDSFKVSKFTWFMFFFLGFAMIFDGYTYMIVPYTMKTIQMEWALGKFETSTLSSWSLVGIVAGAVISGLISVKIGRKKPLTCSIISYTAFTVPIFFAPSFLFFAVFSIAAGLGPRVHTLLSPHCSPKRRPQACRSVFITFGLAWMIAGWFPGGSYRHGRQRHAGMALVLPVRRHSLCLCFVLYFVMPESVHWLVGKGRRRKRSRSCAG